MKDRDFARIVLWLALAFVAGGLVTYGLIDCEKTCGAAVQP